MNKPLWSWKHVFRKLGLRFRNEDAAYTSNENLDYRPLMAPEALEERSMLTGSGFNADFPDNSIEDSTLFEPETTVLFAPATTVAPKTPKPQQMNLFGLFSKLSSICI